MSDSFRFVSGREKPFFSVVLPCYNHAPYLAEAVASLTRQGVPELEAVIVNDGSTDDTPAVARGLLARYPGLHYIEQANAGPAEARNAGIKRAAGKWICTLDSDDILADGFLHAAREGIAQNPACNAVTGAYREFGARESEWKLTRFDPGRLRERGNILNCAPFKKELWAAAGGFDTIPWGGEDWHFWLKALGHGLSLLALPVPMLWYRIRENAGRMAGSRNFLDDQLAMMRSLTPGLYPETEVLSAHDQLTRMHPETERILLRYAERLPKKPILRFWLGLAREGRGENDAARALYDQALDLAGNSPLAARIEERRDRLRAGDAPR